MIDIKLVRDNPEIVKENIRKKFQDEKLVLVDEVREMDSEYRAAKRHGDDLRADRNRLSKEIGGLMRQGKKEEAEAVKKRVGEIAQELLDLEAKEAKLEEEIKNRMMVIPNIIDPSVPIGKDDSENVEVERFGDPFVPDYEIPYHTDIIENLAGIDLHHDDRAALGLLNLFQILHAPQIIAPVFLNSFRLFLLPEG